MSTDFERMAQEYLSKILSEKESGIGAEPIPGDYLFDFNGDLIGILLGKSENNTAIISLIFDPTKERIISANFKIKPKNNPIILNNLEPSQ